MALLTLTAAGGLLLGLGALERRGRDAAWRSVPIRIHVNGTRGKSTVSRLIWSGLVEAGIPAVAKTTGTAPRILLPDRSEHPVRRRAPASIREQLAVLRAARRHGASALVAECMALDPELQWTSEHRMLRATVGVITNVRPDHVEVMGGDERALAASLGNTVPRGGLLVAGDRRAASLLEERARLLGTRLVVAPPPRDGDDDWLAENRRTAVTVLRELGVADDVSARGFARVPHDPGALKTGCWKPGGVATWWMDATAANDPVSLEQLARPAVAAAAAAGEAVVAVYNHREDRGPRLRTFIRHEGLVAAAPTLVVTGSRPALTLWREARSRRGGCRTLFVPPGRLAGWLSLHAAGSHLVFCGNARGMDVARVVSEAAPGA